MYIYHSENILGWKKSPKAIPASGPHWLPEYEMLDVSGTSLRTASLIQFCVFVISVPHQESEKTRNFLFVLLYMQNKNFTFIGAFSLTLRVKLEVSFLFFSIFLGWELSLGLWTAQTG